jgi:hypothetical protein
MGWNKEEITEKIHSAVDTLGRVDQQRLRQWTLVLQRSSPDEVFEALYGVFVDETRPDQRFLDQEYAGKLLLAIKPRCLLEPTDAIRGALRNWEVSVEELPHYFRVALGDQPLRETLKKLEREDLSIVERADLETFHFWLRRPAIDV